jgi:hypothetical protein
MIGPQTSDVRIPSSAHYAQRSAYALFMVRRLHVDVRLATQVLLLQVAVDAHAGDRGRAASPS